MSKGAIDCRSIGLRICVNSIEVEYLPSKQMARVRFPVNAKLNNLALGGERSSFISNIFQSPSRG
ncbi:hypothetical protein H8356DRAFT_1338595, partial [Neocallimastix lanati (nom. inval.)]